jgi:hypothetical protein
MVRDSKLPPLEFLEGALNADASYKSVEKRLTKTNHPFEKALDDHRIGHVCHLELIKAQQ